MQLTPYLQFKTDELREQWESGRLDARVAALVLFVGSFIYLKRGHPIVVTSLYRPKTNDSGVHADWRAADIRVRDWELGLARSVESLVNGLFTYDKKRPHLKCAVLHNVSQDPNGLHLHLQAPKCDTIS